METTERTTLLAAAQDMLFWHHYGGNLWTLGEVVAPRLEDALDAEPDGDPDLRHACRLALDWCIAEGDFSPVLDPTLIPRGERYRDTDAALIERVIPLLRNAATEAALPPPVPRSILGLEASELAPEHSGGNL